MENLMCVHGRIIPWWISVHTYARLCTVFIRDSWSDVWPAVPATLPTCSLVGLIVINNQPTHGPCVTAEFSETYESSCVSVCVGGAVEDRGGWGFGGGQACYDHSPVTDHSLSSSLLSKSTHRALISHLMANGKGGKRRSREEWRGEENMDLDSEGKR